MKLPTERQLEAMRLRTTVNTWTQVAAIMKISPKTAQVLGTQAAAKLLGPNLRDTPDRQLARLFFRLDAEGRVTFKRS